MTRTATIRLATVLFAALLVTACGSGAAAPTTAPTAGKAGAPPTSAKAAGDASRGLQLYTQSCSSCHGVNAKGIPNLGKDLTSSAFMKGQSDAQLLDFTKKGRPASDPANTTKIDMPPKGGNPALTDAQIMDIIAYLRTLQQ